MVHRPSGGCPSAGGPSAWCQLYQPGGPVGLVARRPMGMGRMAACGLRDQFGIAAGHSAPDGVGKAHSIILLGILKARCSMLPPAPLGHFPSEAGGRMSLVAHELCDAWCTGLLGVPVGWWPVSLVALSAWWARQPGGPSANGNGTGGGLWAARSTRDRGRPPGGVLWGAHGLVARQPVGVWWGTGCGWHITSAAILGIEAILLAQRAHLGACAALAEVAEPAPFSDAALCMRPHPWWLFLLPRLPWCLVVPPRPLGEHWDGADGRMTDEVDLPEW